MNKNRTKNIKFKLNPSSFLVKGANKALICDLERNKFYPIPLSLYKILKNEKNKTPEDVVKRYSGDNLEIKSIVEEYFDFLIKEDLIFFSNNSHLYSKIKLDWDYPAIISNAIIDFGLENLQFITEIVKQLENLNCNAVQLRFFEKVVSLVQIEKIITCFEDSLIENLDIFFEYQPFLQENLEKLVIKFPRINSITMYNNPNHIGFEPLNTKGRGKLFSFPSMISMKNCGIVKNFYFITNIKHFSESQNHNTCLNRKISIDKEGYIKNCPSMSHHFGHISNTKLEDVIKNEDFIKYWQIKKDDITKCKDCEFRHICTDCRAYRDDPGDLYSAPLKCGYDPYNGIWEEWSTSPLKQKAIEFYGMQELIKKEPI